ncbi:hypothetical protein [Helicobacter mehlei]|uniref:hypothetical protein n=1 Tax=Helicobacter mehlei TaxID=2316080 RepID=UPI001F370D6A|nr:hypothetical protein [Helicobacter mehlei]
MGIRQSDLILEFFKANPNREIAHPEVVDWLTHEYYKRTGKIFRDPDRGIRNCTNKAFYKKSLREFIATTQIPFCVKI